jgi:hypothetical protein
LTGVVVAHANTVVDAIVVVRTWRRVMFGWGSVGRTLLDNLWYTLYNYACAGCLSNDSLRCESVSLSPYR